MGGLFWAMLLAAAVHPSSEATRLAQARKWDELYLAFAAAKPADYAPADRARISEALAKGCDAMEPSDAILAFSLADKAVALEPGRDALWCLTRAGRKCDQRGAAEKALRQGLSLYPQDGRFGLELGRQLLEDHDPDGALSALAHVPRTSPSASEAARLTRVARTQKLADADARKKTSALERRLARGDAPEPVAPHRGGQDAVDTVSYQSGVGADGMRTRANKWFVLKYFNGNRDFGERAEYEGQLVDAMEEAHRSVESLLGRTRDTPCQVILYTREEFLTHFGPSAAQAIAGLYRESAIRVNGAAELNHETRATLVHEYVHAVVDEIAHFHSQRIPVWMNEGLAEYVEWRYLGRDGPILPMKVGLRTQALEHHTPALASLARGPLIAGDNPALLYAESAMAVGMLLEAGGPETLLGMFEALGNGAPFDATFEQTYGKSLARFQEDLDSELSR